MLDECVPGGASDLTPVRPQAQGCQPSYDCEDNDYSPNYRQSKVLIGFQAFQVRLTAFA